LASGKFGLVIQGPIISQDFDCRENLHRIVNDFHGYFDAIVLSSWEGQPNPGLTHPKVSSIFGSDAITGFDRTGCPLNNGPRKIVSSHRGVRALKERGDIDYVFVFRTDTYADLSLIPETIREYTDRHFDYNKVEQKSFLHFMHMSLMYPYFATDFFIAGHIDDVDRYLSTNITHLDIRFRPYQLVDVDWLIKYMYEHVTNYFNYPEYYNFPFVYKHGILREGVHGAYPTKFIDYWQNMTLHVLAPLPRNFASTLVWRTRTPYRNEIKLSGQYNELVWLEDWDNVRENWLESCQRAAITLYDYADGGKNYDHALHYMFDRYMIIKGSSFNEKLPVFLSEQRIKEAINNTRNSSNVKL